MLKLIECRYTFLPPLRTEDLGVPSTKPAAQKPSAQKPAAPKPAAKQAAAPQLVPKPKPKFVAYDEGNAETTV